MNLTSLINLALEALENPQRRNDFLAAFVKMIDASAAAIVLEDRQHRRASLPLTHGMDRATVDSYTGYYVTRNPYSLLRPSASGAVRKSEELISEADFRETEFYQGWYKPNGWLYPFSITLDTTETECTYLVAMRPPNHPFTEPEMTLVKDIAPTLAWATRSAKREGALKNEINRLRNGTLLDKLARLHLGPRAHEIAIALFDGLGIKEIAYKTGLSISTVRWYVKRIYEKLRVHSRAEFMRLLQDRQ